MEKMSLGGSFRPYVLATAGALGGYALPSALRAFGVL